MNFLSNIDHIPWKYIISMNAAILVMAVTFTSINTVNKTTDNRSQAKEAPFKTSLPQISIDQDRPPKLINPDISWAKPGDDIVIKGENLGSKPFGTLSLNNVPIDVSLIVEWAPTQIVLTIPTKASSGHFGLTYKTTTGQEITLSTSNEIMITSTNQSLDK
jgi:hypothetical protein